MCGVSFKYSSGLEDDFNSCNMERRFRDLKQNLKNHLTTQTHLNQAKTDHAAEVIEKRGREEQGCGAKVRTTCILPSFPWET